MSKVFKYIHTRQVDAIADNDSEFKIELVNIFLEQIPEFITNLTTYLDEKEWKRLAREAHTAKSSVLTFGMEEAGTILKKIQLHAENNEPNLIPDLLSKITQQFEAAIPELEALKQSL